MQEWIHGPWSQTISMATQFLDDTQAKNPLLCCMMQDVQTDESDIELLIPSLFGLLFCHCARLRVRPL